MRSYPRNSPQAAARLIAAALIADGHVCPSELDALQLAQTEARLGLAPGEMERVLQTFCEDVVLAAHPNGALAWCLDEPLIDALADEVDDPGLQRLVLDLITVATAADGHLSDGEQLVLAAIRHGWHARQRARPDPMRARPH